MLCCALHHRYTSKPTNYLQLLGALRKAESVASLKHLVQVCRGSTVSGRVAKAAEGSVRG